MRLYRQIEDIGAFLCYRDFDSCEQHSIRHVLQVGWAAVRKTACYGNDRWTERTAYIRKQSGG